jgi:hypothetical protein
VQLLKDLGIYDHVTRQWLLLCGCAGHWWCTVIERCIDLDSIMMWFWRFIDAWLLNVAWLIVNLSPHSTLQVQVVVNIDNIQIVSAFRTSTLSSLHFLQVQKVLTYYWCLTQFKHRFQIHLPKCFPSLFRVLPLCNTSLSWILSFSGYRQPILTSKGL